MCEKAGWMDVSHREDWEILLMRSPWLLISQEKVYALECFSKIYNTFCTLYWEIVYGISINPIAILIKFQVKTHL